MQRIKNNTIKFGTIEKKASNLLDSISLASSIIPGVKCKRKCDSCCKNYFPLGTLTEAAYIVSYINSTPGLIDIINKNNIIKFHDLHDDLMEKYFPVDAPDFKKEESLKKYQLFIQEMRDRTCVCPFLSNGECLIYKARPAVCRIMVNTVGSDCESRNPHKFLPEILTDKDIISAHQKVLIDLCLTEYDLAEKLVSKILTYKLPPEQMPTTSAMAPIPRYIFLEGKKAYLRLWENNFSIR